MKIRLATTDDADPLAAVHIRTWQVAYRGLIPDETLDSLDVEDRAGRWRAYLAEDHTDTFVALHDGSIIGFCSIEPSRDEAEARSGVGELTSLYVDPDHWRVGAGRALCDAAIAQAQDRQFQTLILWVLEANRGARNFYESMGFQLDPGVGFTRGFGGGAEIAQVRYHIQLSPWAA
jgi:ribosomal protein S18 acetylase RimI-like enzyme